MLSKLHIYYIHNSIATLSLFAVSLLYRSPLILFFLLLVMGLFLVYLKYEKIKLSFYILFSLSGILSESLAVYFGVWKYTNPDILNHVPLWLAPLWGIAALFIINMFNFHNKKQN